MTASSLKHNVTVDYFFYIHLQKTKKMGTGASKLSNQQVQSYSQQTQLQPYVIQQIYEAFIDRAGKNGR